MSEVFSAQFRQLNKVVSIEAIPEAWKQNKVLDVNVKFCLSFNLSFEARATFNQEAIVQRLISEVL